MIYVLHHTKKLIVLRVDIAAYGRMPPTETELQLAAIGDVSGLDDETDWEALYPVEDAG